MEEARIYPSGEPWFADEIHVLGAADELDWRCIGCEARVYPSAWDGNREYKRAACFSLYPGTTHEECGTEALDRLIESEDDGAAQSETAILNAIPSLVSFRPVGQPIVSGSNPISSAEARQRRSGEKPTHSKDVYPRQRRTSGIRRISEIYYHCRHLRRQPLAISGLVGSVYGDYFQWLKNIGEPLRLPYLILIGGIRFSWKPDYSLPEVIIELNVGLRSTTPRPYRILIDQREWTVKERTLFKDRFESKRLELRAAWNESDNKTDNSRATVWAYFLGNQCEDDLMSFRVDHPQKIHLISDIRQKRHGNTSSKKVEQSRV